MSDEERIRDLERWKAWMDLLSDRDTLIDGSALERNGKLISGAKRTISDGAYGGPRDGVGGYVVVAAPSLDDALTLASGCPLLDNEGTVEVRHCKDKPSP